MMTVNEALKHTKPGTPYKFFSIETGKDITNEVVFNLSHYGEKLITKMIMVNEKIHYYI